MIDGLKSYPEMKETGLPWLGRIPEHWQLERMKFILRERNERGFPDEPLLAATQTKGVVRKEEYENRTVLALKDLHLLKRVHVGDFVISLRSFQGGIEYAREQGIISPAYTVLFPNDQSTHGFLAWLLKSKPYIENLSLFVTGIRQGQNIDYQKLGRSALPLPPREERGSIVRFLGYADRCIRSYIRVKQKLIKLLDAQKQAIIHRAVTRGLDPHVRLKSSGVEWIDHIPEHWEVRRAKQLCTAIIDCKNRTPEMVPGGNFTVVRTTNIRNGKFLKQGSYPTDRNNYEIWTYRGAPRKGDVFFTREAPAGEACLVPDTDNLCMGQRMMYFRPDPTLLDAHFLLHSIYGPLIRRYVEVVTNGSTVGHLRLGQVYGMPILWCPLEEQIRIVHFIQEHLEPLFATGERAGKEVAFIREFRKRLIADAVTGKLDVTEAVTRLRDEVGELDALEEATTSVENDEDGVETEVEATPQEAAE